MKCQHAALMDCLSMIKGLLQDIVTALGGTIEVAPSQAFADLFASLEANIIAAIEAGAEAGEEITVTIDTSSGPVEITGSVSIDGEVAIDWAGIKDALDGLLVSAEVSNFADLVALLTDDATTITVDGVVSLDGDQLQSLLDSNQAIVDAINMQVRKDWEAVVGACVLDADGDVIPLTGVFVEYTYQDGAIIGTPTTVLSILDATGTWGTYTLGAGETVGACPLGDVSTIIKDEICLDVDGTVLNAYAIRLVTESATTLLRYEDGLGSTVVGTPTECTCDAVDVISDNGPIGDPAVCLSRKLGADFTSANAGEATHTLNSLYDTDGPIIGWTGTFNVTDSASTIHNFANGQTVSGLASGTATTITFTGNIHWTDGTTEYRCDVVDKAISAQFVVA